MWRRIALAWDVLCNGLPRQTDTVYAQKFVSRYELVNSMSHGAAKALVDGVLDSIIKQLLTEAGHRIIISKDEDFKREGYVYTGSLQLGRKGTKQTVKWG